MNDKIEDDRPLTEEQQKFVDKLSDTDLDVIDRALLENTDRLYYRKVARIVGTTMNGFESRFMGVPDVFFAERIRVLVKIGLLNSEGNLNRMRYSEVKLSENE